MTQRMLANNDAVIAHIVKAMNDECLVEAARDGNINAFAELRNRHFRSLLRTAYRITRNWEDAEDALQDSFLKVFTHLDSFEGRCSFSTWVTRIAINRSLMILRKRNTHNDQSIDADDKHYGSNDRCDMRDLREDPEHLYARHEGSERLRGAIQQLRPCLRNAVALRYLQEYSMQEIADVLCISVASAKSRLFRARLFLRGLLDANTRWSYQSEAACGCYSRARGRAIDLTAVPIRHQARHR